MDHNDFDRALVRAAFELAATEGWARVRVAELARRGDLPLDRARARFPNRTAILLRFGRIADMDALALARDEGPHRDRLFDLLMRRIDVLQSHRGGVLALLRALPVDPPTGLMLSAASLNSMRWMLEGAGISSVGLRGTLRAKGLLAVWLWTIRAWQRDETEDLAATMAALDTALNRAEQAETWLGVKTPSVPPADPPPEPPPIEAAPAGPPI